MTKFNNTEKTVSKGGLVSRFLLIFGIILLMIALGIAGFLIWQYADAQNRYTEIRSVSGLEISTPEQADPNLQLEDLTFDWDALRALNPDVVGWIIVPGTNINYPIVQGTDNSYYLYHLFDSTSSGTGSVFADYKSNPALNGQNNIIYGHNMFDGSMFSDMLMYSDQEYFDNHRKMYICTPERNYELSAVATINVPEDAPLRQFSFADQAAFTAYLQETLASPVTASADMGEVINTTESLYSFVTCETFDASRRIILCGVPVRSVVPGA